MINYSNQTEVDAYLELVNELVDGYVYFWALEDLLKPDQDGDMSYINYYQCDCNIFRFKQIFKNSQ